LERRHPPAHSSRMRVFSNNKQSALGIQPFMARAQAMVPTG
jgi:hypothetical protein